MLYNQFFNFKKDPTDDISKHISKLESSWNDMQNELTKQENLKLPESMLMCRIINTLPDEYFDFKSVWESVSKEERSVDNLTQRLRLLEIRIQQRDECSASSSTALMANAYENKQNMKGKVTKSNEKFQKTRETRECYFCHRKGHLAKDFRYAKQKKLKDKEKNETELKLNSKLSESLISERFNEQDEDIWIGDSGATNHITRNESFYTSYKDFTTQQTVKVGGNEKLIAYGSGTITIETCVKGKWQTHYLTDVWYVPNFSRSVMSLQCTLDKGFEMKMDKKGCKLFKTTTGEVIVEGKRLPGGSYDIEKIESNVQTSDVYNLRDRSNISKPQRYIDAEINIAEGLEPKTYKEAIDSPNAQFWKEAMNEEMNSLTENDVYECTTLPPDQKPIDCKWHHTTKYDWEAVKRIFKYLVGTTEYGIMYQKGHKVGVLESFSDADFAGDPETRRSTSGVVCKLAGGAISWLSQKQRSVSLSTTEAELVAASNTAKEVIWLNRIFSKISPLKEQPIIKVDNASTIKLIKNPEFHKRTKHIEVRHYFVREKYQEARKGVGYDSTDDLTEPTDSYNGLYHAREAWDTLEQVYEPKSRSRILQLKKQFISIRFEEQETMTNYLGRLKICSDHLREAGAEMQDQDLAYSMLAGLPESYDGIIMTFSNVEDKEFTSSKVKHVLLAEYERRMARRVNNTNEALQFGTTTRKEDKKKKNFTCYKCGKEGHIARSCRGKAKTPAPNFQPPRCSTHEIAGSEMLTALSCAIPDNSWVIDSGATHHVCNKREWFTNFQGITSDPILTASGTTRAEGCGDIKFKAYVGKHHVDLKLCNVLYVPNVRRNLLSVSSMENKGKIVNFANRRAQVFDSENRIVAIAHDENGLYVMKGRVILPNAELFNSQKSSQKQTLELWHQRFCHVNNDAIERMAKGELVKRLEISSMDRSLCDDCCVAKSTKEPHKPIRNIRSKRPLELVHTDICGPMPVRSIGGSAYFLTFIDDYSRKITLFCLKHKNEVLKHFDSYLARAERETGHKLKVLRSDNGLEYCNHEFKTRLEQLGIKHELTNTYSPPMNGVAERANRVLLDITRSCLHSAELPQRFWAEAVNTAAYIRNKCYNSALGDKVPDELWSSRKPSVRHLKAFGCLAYSHIPTERRKKLDNRANRCILVGYSSQTKGYRLWCPETQHVIQTKHVKFDESKIGLKWTKVEDEPERYNHIWIEPDNQLEGDIDLKPEAERERNDDTSDQDLVGVNNDDIVQTRPKRIVRNPYGRAGKPKAELHFLDIIEPTTFEQAINSKEAPYWRRAMKDELRSLEDRNTWTLSDLPLDKRPISSRWVFKIKTNSKGDVERFKARLVARGFSQKRNVDFFETYSPVINFSVIRMIFALTINKNWYNRHLDVDNAYLYGELNEEIYMSPPDGSNDEKCEGKVLKLNRPIYGLRQSGLEWYCTLDKALEDIGFRRLAACNCLYTFEDKAVIAVYVDDLALFAESEDILTNIEEKIREKFKIKNLGPIKYFLGVEISYPDENTIILSQGKYTMSILERFNMMECRGVSTPLDNSIPITKKDCPTTDKEKDEIKHVPYRELIGSLLYLANSSRPDMTFAVTKLAQFCSNPGERHWQAAKHILRYIQATKNVSLIYKRGSDDILAFSDSDWANDIDDRRSTSGSAVTINGCLVSWRSKKQNCVSLSTMESEYIALAQTTKEILWITQILENLKCLTNASRPITVFCDNRAAIEFSKNNIENNRSKHIDIRYHYIREKVNSGDIHVNYISTNDNLADIFTKGLKRTAHQNACAAMNLTLKGTPHMGILFTGQDQLVGYSDSDFARDVDSRKSTTGYAFMMNGGTVSWASQRQPIIALSTTESEYIAACSAAKELIWIRRLLQGIGCDITKETELYIDNQAAIKLVENPVFHKRTKHIDVRYHFIRSKHEEGELKVHHVCSSEQLADIMTKPLPRNKFHYLRGLLNILDREG
ncbi:hypothetical protein LAZ67_3003763, partial [Cordylochernes scorpioides]